MVLVMHRNGIQLSGTTARVMGKDPRMIAEALGIEVIEIASLHERPSCSAPTGKPRRSPAAASRR